MTEFQRLMIYKRIYHPQWDACEVSVCSHSEIYIFTLKSRSCFAYMICIYGFNFIYLIYNFLSWKTRFLQFNWDSQSDDISKRKVTRKRYMYNTLYNVKQTNFLNFVTFVFILRITLRKNEIEFNHVLYRMISQPRITRPRIWWRI